MRIRMGFLVAVLAAVGCGTSGDLAGGQVPVSGKVVGKDGRGVGPVALRFYPTEAGLVNGTAETGPDGSFTAKTTPTVDGLVPGKYKVTVTSIPKKGSTPAQVPAKYGDESSTDLVVQVASGQNLTIELK